MESFASTYGRKIRLGLIGGGPGSFIGPVHRMAATMSNCFELSAAVLSSKPEKSLAFARELGIGRSYPNWESLIEAESQREDGVEVIAIMTPNGMHHPTAMAGLEAGMHIICDKPLCNEIAEAQELVEKAKSTGKVFCVTYNYSAYPMVRQAKAMIENGELGDIRQLHVQYVMSYMADPASSAGWRGSRALGGPSHVVGDLATHAFHLASFVTGLEATEILADVGDTIPERMYGSVDDYISCLLNYDNGARGNMWVTNSAAGGEHGLAFKVFGDKGGLEWHQESPNALYHRQLNGFQRILTRRKDGKLYPEAEAAMQLVIGHPEGFHDSFSNLYREVAVAIMTGDQEKVPYPGVLDGAKGVEFIHRTLESSAERKWKELDAF